MVLCFVEVVSGGHAMGRKYICYTRYMLYVIVYMLSFFPPKKEGHSEHAHPKATTIAVTLH